MIPVHTLSTPPVFASACHHLLLLLLRSPFPLVLSVLHFLLALRHFLWRRSFFDYFFNDILVSFSSSGFSTSIFSCLVASLMLYHVLFSFSILVMFVFPSMVIVKVAMTHLWSLPMWIMSLASASLLCLG